MKQSITFVKAASFLLLLSLCEIANAAPRFDGAKGAELSIDVAGAPADGFDTAIGFTVNGTYEIQKDLAVIAGLSYYKWNQNRFGVDLDYSRIPLAGGLRKYFPTQRKELKVYAQAQLELSIDSVDAASVAGVKSSSSKVHFGFIPGFGGEYAFDSNWSALTNFRYHIIDDSYWVLGFGLGYRF